jgi:antitoxin component YwqK of YwqJK toxin-antitoxin module
MISGMYKQQKYDGEWIWYREDGTVTKREVYENGALVNSKPGT